MLIISVVQLFEIVKQAPSIDLIRGWEGSLRKRWVSSHRWDRKMILIQIDLWILLWCNQKWTIWWRSENVSLKSSQEICSANPAKIGWYSSFSLISRVKWERHQIFKKKKNSRYIPILKIGNHAALQFNQMYDGVKWKSKKIELKR